MLRCKLSALLLLFVLPLSVLAAPRIFLLHNGIEEQPVYAKIRAGLCLDIDTSEVFNVYKPGLECGGDQQFSFEIENEPAVLQFTVGLVSHADDTTFDENVCLITTSPKIGKELLFDKAQVLALSEHYYCDVQSEANRIVVRAVASQQSKEQ